MRVRFPSLSLFRLCLERSNLELEISDGGEWRARAQQSLFVHLLLQCLPVNSIQFVVSLLIGQPRFCFSFRESPTNSLPMKLSVRFFTDPFSWLVLRKDKAEGRIQGSLTPRLQTENERNSPKRSHSGRECPQ